METNVIFHEGDRLYYVDVATYHALKIYLICMSAACFRCSTFNRKSTFRVKVRVI